MSTVRRAAQRRVATTRTPASKTAGGPKSSKPPAAPRTPSQVADAFSKESAKGRQGPALNSQSPAGRNPSMPSMRLGGPGFDASAHEIAVSLALGGPMEKPARGLKAGTDLTRQLVWYPDNRPTAKRTNVRFDAQSAQLTALGSGLTTLELSSKTAKTPFTHAFVSLQVREFWVLAPGTTTSAIGPFHLSPWIEGELDKLGLAAKPRRASTQGGEFHDPAIGADASSGAGFSGSSVVSRDAYGSGGWGVGGSGS